MIKVGARGWEQRRIYPAGLERFPTPIYGISCLHEFCSFTASFTHNIWCTEHYSKNNNRTTFNSVSFLPINRTWFLLNVFGISVEDNPTKSIFSPSLSSYFLEKSRLYLNGTQIAHIFSFSSRTRTDMSTKSNCLAQYKRRIEMKVR